MAAMRSAGVPQGEIDAVLVESLDRAVASIAQSLIRCGYPVQLVCMSQMSFGARQLGTMPDAPRAHVVRLAGDSFDVGLAHRREIEKEDAAAASDIAAKAFAEARKKGNAGR